MLSLHTLGVFATIAAVAIALIQAHRAGKLQDCLQKYAAHKPDTPTVQPAVKSEPQQPRKELMV